MYSNQAADLEIAQLLDALPDSVLWMRALRNEHNQLIAFRVEYANQKAIAGSLDGNLTRIGATLLNEPASEHRHQRVAYTIMQTVLDTGIAQEQTYFNTALNNWQLISRSKFKDGILQVTRDVTRLKTDGAEVQQEARLLQTILDTSISNIFVYEAIRDEAGEIVDFNVRLANPVARQDVIKRYGKDPIDYTLLGFRPDSRETGQFTLFCQVVETGQTIWAQHYFPDVDAWYDTSISKIGDGCVVTGVDITQQKKDLLNYKHQSGLLHSVLNGISNGIMAFEAIRDENGEIIDLLITAANEIGAKVAGKPLDQLIGRLALVDFPGIKEAGLFDLYVETIETGIEGQKELYYDADNISLLVHVSTSKLGDGLVVTYNDVTEARRIQQQIEQTADLLQTVIDNSPTALVLYEPIRNDNGDVIDFRYKLVNPIAAKSTGRELDFMKGNTLFSMFPVSAQKGFFDRLIKTLQTGETQRYENHFSDDEIDLWADITMVRQGNDVLTVFQYITEVKQVQQELERSRAELKTVIDTSQTGIFLFSPVRNDRSEVVDFRFRLANKQLASYVGQEAETVIGELGSKWFPDYKTNGLFDFYYKAYQTGETQRFDFHYDGGGIDAWLDIMATKMGDEVLVTFGDYTPLKQLQQQLEGSITELQQSNQNLEQFAYVASHDLQEPLRKIQAFGDIIQTQYAPIIGESGADMIQRMQSAAARMQVLIKDVLAYSRVSAKQEISMAIDLNRIVEDVLNDVETAIDSKQATITVDPLPIIKGDVPQLRQLFQNLISNSLKFAHTDRKPVVVITSRLLRGAEANIPVRPSDASRMFHLIEVSDNGIGFEPHHAERIFQVFQRLHGRSDYQGTGIGLAIVQKVVDNHKGYIAAHGQPSTGATFRILLPEVKYDI